MGAVSLKFECLIKVEVSGENEDVLGIVDRQHADDVIPDFPFSKVDPAQNGRR